MFAPDLVGYLSLAGFGLMTLETIGQFGTYLRSLKSQFSNFHPQIPNSKLPRTRVILCLRGTDPYLDQCIHRLANQNHPDYRLMIVLDSKDDEALPAVERMQSKYGEDRIEILFRKYLLSTCSRRANSFLTALEEIDDNVEAVVLCDGDAVVHQDWLCELTSQLSDEQPAVSGNRWYSPEIPEPGSMVRFYWNAFAVPRMHQDGILWAGSMAIGRKLLEDPELLQVISTAFSEDTRLSGFLIERGYKPVPLPTLPVINRENTTMTDFRGFLVRQMLTARLHHPRWRQIVQSTMIVGFMMWILLPLAIIKGSAAIQPWLLGVSVYTVAAHTCVALCDRAIRRFVRETRRDELPTYSLKRIAMSGAALVMLGFIYPAAVFAAAFATSHVWRGVRYRIAGNGIRMEQNPDWSHKITRECSEVASNLAGRT